MPVELSREKCVAASADDEVGVVGVRPPLRKYMAEGDFFIGAALATSLTKLCLRFIALTDDTKRQNVSLVFYTESVTLSHEPEGVLVDF